MSSDFIMKGFTQLKKNNFCLWNVTQQGKKKSRTNVENNIFDKNI